MPEPDKMFRDHVGTLPMPEFEVTAFSKPPALSEAKVAIVTSAALHVGRDEAFGIEDKKYNVLDRKERAFGLGHWSPNFDRAAFASDINVVYPIDRLKELAERGVIGSVADHHYAYAELSTELADGPPGAWAAERWFYDKTEAGKVLLEARRKLKAAKVPQPMWFYMAVGSES